MELLRVMSMKPELDGEPHGGISGAVLCLLPVAALTSPKGNAFLAFYLYRLRWPISALHLSA